MSDRPDLGVHIAGIAMRNPVMVASGTFGYGAEYEGLIDIRSLGALVTKGISLRPCAGNPPPRIVETPSGMLNAIGLQNVGLECFISEKLPYLRQFTTPVIVNFYGSTVQEYVTLAERLDALPGIAGLEANISCPNVSQGGMLFGADPAAAHDVVARVRQATRLPLIVKLTPNVSSIAAVARSVQDAGADAVSLINTLTGMVIDVATRRPVLANRTGGLSGPAIRPVAVRMVWEVARTVSIPVIGMGGIVTAADALQFFMAGARAVQLGTALFRDPGAPKAVVAGLEQYLRTSGLQRMDDIIGPFA